MREGRSPYVSRMLAETAYSAAASIGSIQAVKKVTALDQESSIYDSADGVDSTVSDNVSGFDPKAVSMASPTLMTALSFQEKYGNPRENKEKEIVDPQTANPENSDETEELSDEEKAAAAEAEKESDPTQLSEEELAVVQSLALQDSKVRNNEEAHVRVGGQYTSQPKYEFETGPDNREYAISGHVDIDSRAIAGNPEETIRKLRIVKRAALAPAEPSTEDRKVAAVASNGIQQAVSEIRQRQAEDLRQLRAEIKSEEAQIALDQSRLENSIAESLTEVGEKPDQKTTAPNIDSPVTIQQSKPTEARIAAIALERAASLAPASFARFSNASASNADLFNASVISKNDISFATVTAAPGLFFDTAA